MFVKIRQSEGKYKGMNWSGKKSEQKRKANKNVKKQTKKEIMEEK